MWCQQPWHVAQDCAPGRAAGRTLLPQEWTHNYTRGTGQGASQGHQLGRAVLSQLQTTTHSGFASAVPPEAGP